MLLIVGLSFFLLNGQASHTNMPWTEVMCKVTRLQRTPSAKEPKNDRELLLSAIYDCQYEFAIKLIDSGLNANYVESRTTPLFAAVGFGENNIVAELLKHGADPNFVPRHSSADTALMNAAFSENEGAVRLLLESGANPNAKGHLGDTALMRAAYKGNKKIVEILLRNGANPLLRDNFKETAVDDALAGKHPDIAELIRTWPASDH